MRVAIVHDYLTQRGGAERVVLAMARAFPDAPIHTSLFNPATTFPEFSGLDVRPLPIDRVGALRRNHRLALPLLASSFSRLHVDADVVLCSSSGWAHGIRTSGRKVVYCYNPARWLYQPDDYARAGSAARLIASAAGAPLRRWDRRSALSADRYLAISSLVQGRIRATYGIEAGLLPPPYGIDTTGPQRPMAGCRPGSFLCVSRLLPYKHVESVIRAFESHPHEQLVVVGTGPEEARLRRLAPPNVRLVGRIEDDELRWLYATCAAVVAASFEDFGLTPLEAAAFGRPSAVLGSGGYLETVVEGRTGVFFERPEPAAIAQTLSRIRDGRWDAEEIMGHAAGFSEEAFAERLRDEVMRGAASGRTIPR
jgi:glycosyltransferase involved in cell wall biosynthesis